MTSRSIFSHNRFFHAFKKATAAISGMLFLVSTNAAFAQQAPPPTSRTVAPPVIPTAAANAAAAIQHGNVAPVAAQMNLGSTNATMALPQATAVQVGGHIQYFNAGAMVTPAQFLAAQQALQAGKQALEIANTGAAIGGRFNLNVGTNGIAIPAGVTGLAFNTVSPIAGDLVNAGTVYGFATNASNPTVTIAANSVLNNGLITTVTPASLQSAFNALSSANLVVLGVNGVTNTGTISSSRDLTVASTAGALSNSGTLSAQNSLNLITGNGFISNSGSIAAGNDVGIGTNGGGALYINGTGGTVQAAGAINIATINKALNIVGGNYFSHNLNINVGSGTIDGVVGVVSGHLNSNASVEHFYTDTPVLTLGNNCITGDPTFANAGGSLNIFGVNTFSEDVTILAGKNIFAGDTNAQIVAPGKNVTMIAGGTVTINGGGFTTSNIDPSGAQVQDTDITGGTPPTYAGGGAAGATATVSFDGSSKGGSIVLNTSTANNVIDTHNPAGAGGNVTLAAYSNASAGTGAIVFRNNTVSINTQGVGGNGGNVSLIAGRKDVSNAFGVFLGTVLTNSNLQSGSVSIDTANPKVSSGSTLTYISNGTEQSSKTVVADGSDRNTNGVNYTTISTAGLGGRATLAGAGNGGNAGAITINAGALVGGAIDAYGGGGAGGSSPANGNPGQNGGNGGSGAPVNITLSRDSSLSTIGNLNASGGGGGGGAGGNFWFDGASSRFTTGGTGGAGGFAGPVTITASGVGRSIQVGDVFAAHGGAGGNGGNSGPSDVVGTGGGGGGSLGGGGGGGAAGDDIFFNTVYAPAGGGGSGFRGGGGGGTGFAANALGGSGGGVVVGAAGAGSVPGQAGNIGAGGNGALSTGASGAGGVNLGGGKAGVTGGTATVIIGTDGAAVPSGAANNAVIGVTTSGSISIGTALSNPSVYGQSVNLSANGGSLNYSGTIVGTSTNTWHADADISTPGGGNGVEQSAGLTISTGKGSIGAPANPFVTNSPNLNVNTTGTAGGAWITDNFAGTVDLRGTNTIGATGNLPFVLKAPSGSVNMADGGNSKLNAGSVDINTNAFSMFLTGTKITSAGNVKITAGTQIYDQASIDAGSLDLSGSSVHIQNGANLKATGTANVTSPDFLVDSAQLQAANMNVIGASSAIVQNSGTVTGTSSVHINSASNRVLSVGQIIGGTVLIEGNTVGSEAAEITVDTGAITGTDITLHGASTSLSNGAIVSGGGVVTVNASGSVNVLSSSTLNGDTTLHVTTPTLTVGEAGNPPPFSTVSSNNGTLDLQVGNLTVNQTGRLQAGNLGLNSPNIVNNGAISATNLTIVNTAGNLTVSGTGSFVSTQSLSLASAGDLALGAGVDLSKFIHGTSNIVFVAGRDILYNGGGTSTLSTGGLANDSGNLTMLAGVTWAWNATAPTTITPTGVSGTGGGVLLNNSGALNIDTSAGTTGNNAGNVAVYTNRGTSDGAVSLGIVRTDAQIIDNSNHNGSVTVIADTTQSTGLVTDDIVAGSGGGALISNNNANINASTAQTVMSSPVFTNGVLASGSFGQGTLNPNGGVVMNKIFAPGTNVTIKAGGGISIGDITTAGAGGFTGTGGNAGSVLLDTKSGVNSIDVGWIRAYGGGGSGAGGLGGNGFAGGTGGNVTLNTKGNVNVTGDINTSGGGGGGGGFSPGNLGGAGGNAGSVNIDAHVGNVVIQGPVLSSGGAGGSSGVVGDSTRGGGGGGSFGGGGGGAFGGAGGGGFLGGGGSSGSGYGTGGGIYGAGISLGGSTSTDGQNGAGGNGLNGYQGGLFGISGEGGTAQGANVKQVGQTGSGSGGAGGQSGGLVADVGSFSIQNSIKSAGTGVLPFQPPLTGYTYAAIGNSGFGNEIISSYGGGSATVSLTSTAPLSLAGSVGAPGITGNLTAGNVSIVGSTTYVKFGTVNINAGSLTNQGNLAAQVGDTTITGLTNQGPLGPPATLNLNNSGVISSLNGNVNISSKAANNLVFGGGGSIQAANGNITLSATDNVTNDAGNYLIAAGNQTFAPGAGNQASLNAPGPTQSLWIQPNVQVVSTGKLVLNTSNLILDSTPVGNPLVITTSGPGMNIINTVGDLNLSLNIQLPGKNLFLGSVGNIVGNGLTGIDLSSSTGNGGNLSMAAGFNLSNSKGIVTIGTPNAGGSIVLPNVLIQTSTSKPGSNGGSVTVAARNGNIELDNIFAQSGNSNGGSVLLFGNGVKVGPINSSGGAANNSVVLIKSGTTSTTGGTITYTAGARNTGFGAGVYLNTGDTGNIGLLGNVTAGSVTAQTGGAGSVNSAVGTLVTATDAVGTGLHVTAGTGGINSFVNPLAFSSALVGVSTTGNAFLSTGTKTVSIDGATAQQLQIVDTNATAAVTINGDINSNNFLLSTPNGGSITNAANIAGVNGINGANATSLHFVTDKFTNNAGSTVKGALVQVDASTTSNLIIDNRGTLQADNGSILINALPGANSVVSITGGGTMAGTNGTVNINANGATGNVHFTGSQIFTATTSNINATGAAGSVTFDNGAVVNATSALNLNTTTLNLLGTLNAVTGTPLRFNSPNNLGTIANSNGDVNLPGGLIFHGQSLAILASGNVNAGPGVIIDLSNGNASFNGGNGGTLTVFAGYNFSIRPDANIGTGGQVGPDGTVYYLGTPSTSGGSINLSGTEVSTKSTIGANGGNILMLAHNGAINNGTITVGNLNTSAIGAGTAGSVTLFGRGGITTGDVNTNGFNAGAVSIVAGTPNITTSNGNGVQVWNGVVNPAFVPGLVGPTYTATPDNASGNILVGNVTARPSGGTDTSVTLVTQGAGSVNVKSAAIVDAKNVVAVAGTGGVGSLANPFAMNATNVTLSSDNLSAAGGHARGDVYATNLSSTTLIHAPVLAFVAYPALPLVPNNFFLTTGKIWDLKEVGTNGSITLAFFNKPLVATDFRLHSTGTGSISQVSAAEIVDTQIANLTTEGAPIGALGQPIQLRNTTQLHFEGTPTGSTIIQVDTATNTTLTGANTSADARLTSLNGGITFGAGSTLVSTSNVLINTNGSVTQTDTGLATTVKSPVITINTTGGSIGTNAQALNIGSQTGALTLTTTSKNGAANDDTFLNNVSSTLLIDSSTARNYSLSSPGTAITVATSPFTGILASQNVTITTGSTGSITIPTPVSGIISSTGNVTLTTGDFSIDSDLATGIIAGGNIGITAANNLTSKGIMAAAGNMSLQAGNILTLDTASTTTALGTMTINANSLVTKGTEGSLGDAGVTVTNSWNNSGLFRAGKVLATTANANLTANVGSLSNSGTISSTQNMSLTATANSTVNGDIVNLAGGIVNAGGTLTAAGHTISNSSSAIATGDVTLTTSTTDNTAFIKNILGGNLKSTAGKVKATTFGYTNAGTTSAFGNYTIIASDNVNQNNSLVAGGGLNISGVLDPTNLHETKNVNFTGATTSITGDAVITAHNVLSTNSTLNVSNGALVITGAVDLSGVLPAPSHAGDVSFLNGAGANVLTATKGISVLTDTTTLQGTSTAGTGLGSIADLVIDGQHNINISGTTKADRDILVNGVMGTTTTAGTISALNGKAIFDVGSFTNTGAIGANGFVHVTTEIGDMTNNGGSIQSTNGDITFNVTGDFKQLTAPALTKAAVGGVTIIATNITNQGGILAGGNMAMTATPNASVNGDIVNSATGIINAGGTLTAAGRTISNSGSTTAAGDVTLTTSTTDNTAFMKNLTGGILRSTGGKVKATTFGFTNDGTTSAFGNYTIIASDNVNQNNSLTAGGGLNISGVLDATTLHETKNVNFTGATTSVTGDTVITAHDLLSSNSTVNVTNGGLVISGAVDVSGLLPAPTRAHDVSFLNGAGANVLSATNGISILTDTATLQGTTTAGTGSGSTADLVIDGQHNINISGTTKADHNILVNGVFGTTTTAGTMSAINGTTTIDVGSFSNTAIITSNGLVHITTEIGDMTNNGGAIQTVGGDITYIVAGDFKQPTVGSFSAANGGLTIIAKNIGNTGNIDATGNMVLTADNDINNSGNIRPDFMLTAQSKTFENTGLVRSFSNMVIHASEKITNDTAGNILVGPVGNAFIGTLTLTTDVLLNKGSVTANGNIVITNGTNVAGDTGALTSMNNSGSIAAGSNVVPTTIGDLQISALSVTNSGSLNATRDALVNGGLAVSGDVLASNIIDSTGGSVTTGGNLTLAGKNITLNNATAGGTLIAAGATIGGVSNYSNTFKSLAGGTINGVNGTTVVSKSIDIQGIVKSTNATADVILDSSTTGTITVGSGSNAAAKVDSAHDLIVITNLVDNFGTIKSANVSSVLTVSSFTNELTGAVSGKDTAITTTSVKNDGSFDVSGQLFLYGLTNGITSSALGNGSIKVGEGGSLTIQTTGANDIGVLNAQINRGGAGVHGANVLLLAGGDITNAISNTTIDTSSALGNAGSISLIAGTGNNVSRTGQFSTALDTASGFGTGNIDLGNAANNHNSTFNASTTAATSKGGNVNVIALNGWVSMKPINPGLADPTDPSQNNITAKGTAGGTSGTVLVSAGGINPAPIIYVGAYPITGTAMTIGNIDTNGAGNAGSINLFSSNPNFQGSVSFTNGSTGAVLTTTPPAGSLTTGSIMSGVLNTSTGHGAVDNANAAISIYTKGDVNFGSTNTAQTSSTHHWNIHANQGTITLATQNLRAVADANGDGGSIDVEAGNVTYLNQNPGVGSALQFLATGTNKPGDIRFVRNSTSLLVLGTAGYDLFVDNRGGTNKDGGNITVINGGQLFVVLTPVAPTTPTGSDIGLRYAPGTNITLQAGNLATGLLTLNGSLDTSAKTAGDAGGNVTLVSNSSTIFNYGDTSSKNQNGIQGSIKVAGAGGGANGSIHLENKGGSLTYNPTTANAFSAVKNVDLIGSLLTGTGNVALTVSQTINATGNVSLTSNVPVGATGNATIALTKGITAGGDVFINLNAGNGTTAFTNPVGANISADNVHAINMSTKGSSFTLASNINTSSSVGQITLTQLASAGASTVAITGNLTAAGSNADVSIDNTASTTGSIAVKAITAASDINLSNTSGGNGSVVNTGALTAATGSVSLSNLLTNTTGAPTGAVTVSGVISAANNVAISSDGMGFGGKANITIGQNVTATAGSILLDATGATGGGAVVTSGTATLTTSNASGALHASSGGTIGSGASGLSINSANVDFQANGAIIVTDKLASTVNMNASKSNTSTISVTTPATLNTSGQIAAPLGVTLQVTGANKDLNLDVALRGTNILTNASTSGATKGGIVNLTVAANGHITNDANNIVAETVNFTTGSNGSVGSPAQPMHIDASNVSFNVPGNGSILIAGQRTSQLTVLTAVNNTGNVTINSASTLLFKGTLAGTGNVKLDAPSINLTGSIGTSTTSGNIVLISSFDISGAGKLTGLSVALNSDGGNIGGTTAATALNVNTGKLPTVQTGGFAGSVNIKNAYAGAAPLVLDTAANSFGNFTLTTGSGITMKNVTVANGSLNITAAKGETLVLHDATISATNGGITLQNTAGTIRIGDLKSTSVANIVDNNIAITTQGTTGGAINIVIGAVPKVPTGGFAPLNTFISVTGTGSMFFGTAGKAATSSSAQVPSINVVGFTNALHPVIANLQAKNTMLQFNAGKLNTNITLNQGVRIFADPPTPTTAPSDTVMSVPSINVDATKTAPVVRPSGMTVSFAPLSNSSSAVAAAIAGAPSVSMNFAPVQNFSAATLAQLAAQAMATPRAEQFATETELMNGEIPATLSSDQGIKVATRVASNTVLTGGITKHVAGIKTMELTKGSVVFAPTVDTVVHTNYGDVTIGANSVVLVLSFNGGVAVYNLHDTKRGAVAIQCGDHTLGTAPGQSVVLTSATNASFDEINPAQLFLYRNINEQSLAPAMKAFTVEFAPLSAINAVLPLKQLVNSKEPAARRLADNMLKTAAIVHQVHAAKGGYQQVLHPSVAAWLQ